MTAEQRPRFDVKQLRNLANADLTNAAGIDRDKVKALRDSLRLAADEIDRLQERLQTSEARQRLLEAVAEATNNYFDDRAKGGSAEMRDALKALRAFDEAKESK